MFKIISHYWYTLKATLIIGYVFFSIPHTRTVIKTRNFRELRRLCLAAKCLIKFIRDAKKLNCVSTRVSFPAIGTLLSSVIGIIWICEKMGMSIKLIQDKTKRNNIPEFFENLILFPHCCPLEDFTKIKKPISNIKYLEEINFGFSGAMHEFAAHKLSSEYGYKIISMLTMNEEHQQQADEWYHNNIKSKCIGVHYRGTDVVIDTSRKIKIDAYISYLKRVLDEDSHIFACSDQAQFITQINSAFPNRVIARDIRRSYTHETLHSISDLQIREDAYIDMLILAKTKLIYTVGSRLIDCIRFFNPAIKIISLENKHRNKIGSKHIPNYLPVPEEDFVRQIRQEAIKEWNTPPYF